MPVFSRRGITQPAIRRLARKGENDSAAPLPSVSFVMRAKWVRLRRRDKAHQLPHLRFAPKGSTHCCGCSLTADARVSVSQYGRGSSRRSQSVRMRPPPCSPLDLAGALSFSPTQVSREHHQGRSHLVRFASLPFPSQVLTVFSAFAQHGARSPQNGDV